VGRQNHIQKLLVNHNRRLQALKERKALGGLDAPVGISLEIEEIEAEIEQLQAELAELQRPAAGATRVSSPQSSEGRPLIANRYRIEDLLGQGGMGEVYRGTDAQTDETVAIKILKPEVVNNPDLVARFIREGEALRQLNHPSIVKMLAAVEETGRHFLVMEYVKGGSLQDLLQQQSPITIRRTVEICLDLADALTRAHRLNIIHRDLKPDNVLLAEDGTPRLTDFGIAHLVDNEQLTQTGALIGTPHYLSPEACNGERIDTRTDIWAFGIILFEMLTGRRAFTGASVPALLMAIVTQPVPDVAELCPDIPDALADLVYRMLEKDPRQRIPSVRLVGAELEAIFEDRAISPTPAEPPDPATLAQKSRRFEPLPTEMRASRHNLPVQPTPIVGRVTELAKLNTLLVEPDVRLVTILGPGGMGKTRLALELASAQLPRFERGVYFVELAPLQAANSMVAAIAQAVNFPLDGGQDTRTPQQQLLDYLREKQMMLVLDNFEHLLEGASLVSDILGAAPQVKIVVTSRAKLNLQSEHLFQLEGMDLPQADTEPPAVVTQSSAVALFLQSAGRLQPGFELADDDAPAVAQICRLVQGMPLGIILAAAWIELLSPAEIAAEINRSLDFLESDLRDVPERHRSIRAVFDYSWQLLSPREQEIFQTLSVFRGGFSREAAQAVTGASLRDLMALNQKSLLYRAPTGRYELHELLHQYAAGQLAQHPAAGEAVHNAHCAYYACMMQQWITDLIGKEAIDAEQENLLIAWDWAVAHGQVEPIGQLVDGLGWIYARDQESYKKQVVACQRAAEKIADIDSAEAKVVLAKILFVESMVTQGLEGGEAADQILQKCLELLDAPDLKEQDTRTLRVDALWSKGMLHLMHTYNPAKARECFQQSLTLAKASDDQKRQAGALSGLIEVARSLEEFEQAKQLAQECLALYQTGPGRGGVLMELGHIARFQNQMKISKDYYQEALAIYQEFDAHSGIAYAQKNLSSVFRQEGMFNEAYTLCEESVAISRDLGSRYELAFLIESFATEALHLGHLEQAKQLTEESMALFQALDEKIGVGMAAWGLCSCSMHLGQYEAAETHGHMALDVAREIDHQESTHCPGRGPDNEPLTGSRE